MKEYTAKIVGKNDEQGTTLFTVEFTKGEKTVTETCIPQNRQGFDHWKNSRLEAMNSDFSDLNVGDVLTASEAVALDEPTPEEKEANLKAQKRWEFQEAVELAKLERDALELGIVNPLKEVIKR